MKAFEKYIRTEARKHGVKVRIYNKDIVWVNGTACSGSFGYEDKLIEVAKKGDWLYILAHEFCHMLQWVEGKKQYEAECEENDIMDNWLSYEIEPSEAELDQCFRVVVESELDCEKRAYRMLQQFKIPCGDYIQKANAYLNFHQIVREFRKWMPQGKHLSETPAIWQNMPPKFCTRLKLSKKLRNEYIWLLGIEE